MTSHVAKPFACLLDQPVTLGDQRGCIKILYEKGNVVLKRSTSQKGVFRGLHRQRAPSLQDKIIRVLSGRIYDFVTDPDDPQGVIWYREITPETDWVHIAAHLAHGFYAITDVEFEYFCDGRYDEAAEDSYFVADVLSEALSLGDMQLSNKDKAGIPLARPVRQAN
ncbi:dTDP-4-keto-6-deoxy-D-glucose epimerase [Rhizobium sp. S-51]|uniref:dTDP-4-dehydrorhamnose 3,5-epimerase n=1 Tax=Rhizobium terricola TaxID=2728849 RepID=A0A7Y0AYB8_9HYPH|nr:dTDP-4-dehydrorhamnose 3,5-epimerase family protein [Rhizobium terricola]NML75698.1 dTDP-4-keto-6-deoxy-D-glucose epimerase [Rhizobium terricola]